MTAPVLAPDPTRCPDCRAPLAGPGACPACGLPLTGTAAVRLWQVDSELLRLDARRTDLLAERVRLLAALRTGGPAPAPAPRAPVTPWPATVPAPRQEWTPQRVQNLLLSLGGLLLAVAALVFTAVTYDRLGAGGRAAVLVLLTALAATAAPRLSSRGLTATAETVAAVALVLAALDAYGLRTLGLAQDSDRLAYAAGSAAVLALVSAAYARVVPLRVPEVAAALLAQLPVPLLLVREEPSAATFGVVLAAQAGADLGLLARADRLRLPRAARAALVAATAVLLLLALQASVITSLVDDPGPGAVALLTCAAVLAGAAALVRDTTGRALLSAGAVVLPGVAAYALTSDVTTTAALAVSATGLLAVLAAAQLPRALRLGPVAGALAVSTGGLLLVARPAAQGLLLPLDWLTDPWSLAPGRGLRGALSPTEVWTGTLTTPVVLLAAALAAAGAGFALHRVRRAAPAVAGLAAAALALLPLGLGLPYDAGLGLLVVLAAALSALAWWQARPRPTVALGLAGSGTALALLAAGWSTASEGATLAVLPLVTVLLAGLASAHLPTGPALTALAGLTGTGLLAALGASADLSADQVGALLLLAVAALLGLALLLDHARRTAAELAAVAVAVTAVGLSAADTGWLSWTLAGTGLMAIATGLRSDRRAAAPAGAVLLSASSWVRLADAGVTAPEPYVVPLALVALGLGWLRRRRVPGTTSWAAYGPGLSLALVPSLLVSLEGSSLVRPLLLGLAALGVLLVGARARLRAPLVLGAGVLALDALDLVGPYAAALPRWLSLGTAGALLVAVGATYEQRRRDVARLRERYDALA